LGPPGPQRHLLTLGSRYSPFNKHLKLHNGAIKDDEDPEGEYKPKIRKRDRKSMVARDKAMGRAEELAVTKALEEMVDDDGTPRKKVSHPILGRTGPLWAIMANLV
jgi:hypothetical protein